MTSLVALPAGVTATDCRGATSEGRVAIATPPATRRTMGPMRMAGESRRLRCGTC